MGAAAHSFTDVFRGTRARLAAGFLLLYASLYLLPLPVRPLASPDEVRYGAIAHEMIASGDWVVPRFNGVRYFEKPPLGYWLDAASLRLLGETALALRLPAALATGLTALIVFGLVRRFATPFAARTAAAVYLTTFLVAGVGTFAVLDAFLALFLTAALASYFCAIETAHKDHRRAWLVLCGAACGAAFLVKGFLALAIPVVVAAPYLALRRRWRTLLASPWWPVAAAAVVVLPWAVLIQLREPDFWRYFFWVEHIQRFTAENAQHAQPFWYYFEWLPLAGWPWVWLWPAALLGLRRAAGPRGSSAIDRPLVGYAAAWAALPLLFLSFSSGKLPTYILPCFAPLAMLIGIGLEPYLATGRQRAWRGGALLIAALFTAVLAALIANAGGAWGEPAFGPDEQPKLVTFAVLMAVGAGCALYAAFGQARAARIAAVAGTGGALILAVQVAVPQRILDNVAPAVAVERYAAARADTILISDAPLFGTVAFVSKRDDVYMLSPGEIGYGLGYPEARHRLLDAAGLERLIETNRGGHAIVIVGESSTEERIASVLPATAERSEHGKVIVWRIPPS
jgi:4-amino-4-deoxy-L-arabinose transferase